ncbi:proprotein convertase P-domain-containing protein [Cellulophaga baltica]|uniref:reprolysin-like metallopeptidase n=1 Tax=Cellulophaga TaxID=104264 RepID=UPI001C072907|nr:MULTISPECIES: zinc-dependent metalloprotease family protein [Cellulophaga]MBU2997815.1 proprotein convertase P-domain-containing protein [Cellulophaga baltica]MDO6769211.1 M12 family metallo-peptidase [Cellulophaga sp. 1_MG-2023]
MATNLRLVFTIPIFFICFYGVAQDDYWHENTSNSQKTSNTLKNIKVHTAKVYNLSEADFSQKLSKITSKQAINKVYFPDATGKMYAFEIEEATVFSPELAQKYPQIKSYKGVSTDTDTAKKIRFSVSEDGVQTMMLDKSGGDATFMQKTADGDYVLYARDATDVLDNDFVCATEEAVVSVKTLALSSKLVSDKVLRKFRIAVAATGEYTEYHGGTVANALAAINATLTRINMVFEVDLGVTLELVADNDLVVYTDPDTDPFDTSLNTEAQSTFSSEIGASNYDIGHLFHADFDGGDAGFIGSVCVDSEKGSAYSSGQNPEGDLFDIDFVAHEIGHQLGANHTWSFESEGTLVQTEPASGSTIMSYAGIVGSNNVATNADDYFHYSSIKQISENLESTSCAEVISLSNNPPVLTDLVNYTIPIGTAFVLEAEATDSDVDDVLSYTWEQIDDGIVTNTTFGPDNPSGANFRSFEPTTNTSRYFPKLSSVTSGNLTQTNPTENSAWETVSNVEREMNFAVTVRDNNDEGGQVVSDEMAVNVLSSAGPFSVLSQDAEVTYDGGSTQEVIWDVADTNNSTINAQTVDIYLSYDGGVTFSELIADDVVNDGSYDVLLPGEATTQARLMVKASDNIFFAVNASDFTITNSDIVLNFSSLEYEVCQPDDLIVPFVYETNTGFTETATFSVTGLPDGLVATFSEDTATEDETDIEITFTGTGDVDAGVYPISVIATATSFTQQVDIDVRISNTSFSEVVLTSPEDDFVDASLYQTFEWNEEILSTSYDVEIATDESFTDIVETANVLVNSYTTTGLDSETVYYWHVKPKNGCGEGAFSTANSFTTQTISCQTTAASLVPVTISSSGTSTITSTVTFVEDLPVSDINVILDITHTYLSDLTIKLTSPEGTSVILVSNSCGSSRNINATFDNSASSYSCGTNPAISGTVKPLGSLTSFNGESSQGEWILEISDNVNGDGGSLNNFEIELCVEGEFRPDEDNDGVFDDGDDLCLNTPEGQEVDANGCAVYRFDSTNFSVEIDSESCINNNDGEIRIEASTSLNYTATITGEGLDMVASFTSFYSLENLEAGSYYICITGVDGSISYEEYCLDAIVTQPDELSVTSDISASDNQVDLFLSGSDTYTIELNGVATEVASDQITLDLKDGFNTLKVSTNLSCQGVYEDTILIANDPYISPNPATNETTIYTGITYDNCKVQIFSTNGSLVKEITYENSSSTLDFEVYSLPKGVYVIRLTGDNLKQTLKLIKN